MNNIVRKKGCFTINYVLLNGITNFWTFRRIAPLGLLTLEVYGFKSIILFHFESLTYYIVIILQRIRIVNFYTPNFSYIFQVLVFQSHIMITRPY